MWYIYFLKSEKDNSIYIGRTNDIPRRIREHNGGHTSSLKSKRPLTLLGSIECSSLNEAIQLEKEYKKGYKREEIKRIFKKNGDVAEWSKAPRC